MRVNFSDPASAEPRERHCSRIRRHGDLPSSERLHVEAEYQRFDWRGRVEWNGADFYDLFGPTKVRAGRGTWSASAARPRSIFDEPRRLDLDIEGAFAGNLDRLPDYQNVPVDVDRLLTLDARLSFTDVRNSLGNVDDETGRRWSVGMTGQVVESTFVPQVYATYDRGCAAAARAFLGVAARRCRLVAERSDEPFANFFFGGFGNNWVDHLDEKRYREVQSFPGADLNEIGGRNFVKGTLELNLPPWRFRRAGTPGFHATWARPAIFVGALATNLDADGRQTCGDERRRRRSTFDSACSRRWR